MFSTPANCSQLQHAAKQGFASMLAALIIVFREAIEAGLIVSIILAATQGVAYRGRMVAFGIGSGVAGACLLALFAGQLGRLADGMGQELFQATVLIIAVVMLGWHTTWMARHGRETAREMKALGAAVQNGSRTLFALAIVIAIAVLREGAEIVLFLYGIAMGGDATASSMALGGLLGIAAGVGLSWAMYRGLLAIPQRRLFAVTGLMVTLVAAGLASQAIGLLQSADYANFLSMPLWDSSWMISQSSLPGKALHAMVGYTDKPSGLQLIGYILTFSVIWGVSRAGRSPPTTIAPRGVRNSPQTRSV